jgi:NCS1 family nucleobase:cation symporter-1
MAFQDHKTSGSDGYSVSAEPAEIGSSRAVRRTRFSLAVDQEPSSFAASANASNADFDPIPPSKRTWGTGAYVAYWMADAWAVSNWEVGMYSVWLYRMRQLNIVQPLR